MLARSPKLDVVVLDRLLRSGQVHQHRQLVTRRGRQCGLRSGRQVLLGGPGTGARPPRAPPPPGHVRYWTTSSSTCSHSPSGSVAGRDSMVSTVTSTGLASVAPLEVRARQVSSCCGCPCGPWPLTVWEAREVGTEPVDLWLYGGRCGGRATAVRRLRLGKFSR